MGDHYNRYYVLKLLKLSHMYSWRIQSTYELTSFNFLQMFKVLGQAGTCQRVQVHMCASKHVGIEGRACILSLKHG